MKVHLINPPPKSRRAGGRKKTVAKKRTKRAPKKRRARNPAKPKRRRRGRRTNNPSLKGLGREFSQFIPRLAGKLAVMWVVQRYGGAGQLLGGGQVQSQAAGGSWSAGQYILAYLTAVYGSKLLGKVVNAAGFREGAMDLILTKFVWTEGIARSDWARQQFGAPQVAYSPDTGQSWIQQGGQWSAMQGLVEADALDGLVEADALDGTGGSAYGHLVDADTLSPRRAKNARYSGSAYSSNYNAAYAF